MPRTGELYIFGDSLSDDGATATQSDQEPVDRYFFGRASNGLLWHENIRNDLAVAPAATSISQAPDLTGYLSGSDLNGVNFAHGGAVSSSTSNPERPGAVQQAEGFAALVASGDIPAPDDQDVFVIWIGGNDFLALEDASVADLFRILNLGSEINENIETTVDILTAAGAKNFLIIGQPTIGGAFLGDLAPSGSLLATLWNRLTGDFNALLEDYTQSLDDVEGQSALFIDIAEFIEDLEADPSAYGFTNVTSDIFTDDADVLDQSYFSVDGIHPTGTGHAAIAEYIVGVAAEAGFDLTALAGNVLPGSERDDTLTGTDGNDSITGGAGDDDIDGKVGNDSAFLNGSETLFTLSLADDITLTDRSGAEGTDMLHSIETLQFADSSLDLSKFDDATSLSSDDFRTLTEVYVSYFDRAPDALGLTFWADAFATGTSLSRIAELFATSPEALSVFPQDLPADEFVTSVYQNALGRMPDDVGFEFWTGALDSGGVSRAQFVLEVLKGARAEAPDDATEDFLTQQAEDQVYLDNKVDIGLHYSAILGLSDGAKAASVMELFDGSPDKIAAALAAADDAYATAVMSDGSGAFLVQLIGVVDDPFAV